MDVPAQPDEPVKYTTPPRVQAWFLGRSRARWKRKYQKLKVEAKRLQNNANDLTKSRAKWRAEARELEQRVQELAAQNATLQQQIAALKKDGAPGGRSGRR